VTITNGYTTLADIKTLLRITTTDADDDAVLEALITQSSRLFDGETARRYYTTAADETRTYQAEPDGVLCFVDDIVSITTLKTDDDGDRVYETTWATTDYDTKPDNAALNGYPPMWLEIAPNGRYTFPTQSRGVQLVGKFGYSTSAPADVRQAVEDIAVTAYKRRFGENTESAATVTAAGVVLTPRDIPMSAWRVINRYRKLI